MTRIMTFREDSTCNVSNDPSSQGICPKKWNWCCLECLNLNIATHLSYKERESDLKMWITSWLTAFAGSNFYVRCDGPWHIFKQLFGQPRRYTFVENNTNKLNWYNSDTDKYPTDPLCLYCIKVISLWFWLCTQRRIAMNVNKGIWHITTT